jgi:hypothetical protein
MSGGIEGWKRAGFATSATPAREPGTKSGQDGLLKRLTSMFRA